MRYSQNNLQNMTDLNRKATGAFVNPINIVPFNANTLIIKGPRLSEFRPDIIKSRINSFGEKQEYLEAVPLSTPFCSYEKHTELFRSGFCTGALISKDTILTAGHCFDKYSDSDCKNKVSFVFDILKKNDFQTLVNLQVPTLKSNFQSISGYAVNKDSVYKCERIIHKSSENIYKNGRYVIDKTVPDFALIKLNRDVIGYTAPKLFETSKIETINSKSMRNPAILNFGPSVSKGSYIKSYGHPLGLPLMEINSGGIVEIHNNYFDSKIDNYNSSSGSGVFDLNKELLIGILARGAKTAFVLDIENKENKEVECVRSRYCDRDGGCYSYTESISIKTIYSTIQEEYPELWDELFENYLDYLNLN